MTLSDNQLPPQPDPLGDHRKDVKKVSWLKYWWYTLKLWWVLRKPRKIIREAIEDAKARGPRDVEGTPKWTNSRAAPQEGTWKTGPPPVVGCEEEVLQRVPPQELGKCECAPPRGKPQIGAPVDVEYHEGDESYKGASHA